jgi:hypothetical protein
VSHKTSSLRLKCIHQMYSMLLRIDAPKHNRGLELGLFHVAAEIGFSVGCINPLLDERARISRTYRVNLDLPERFCLHLVLVMLWDHLSKRAYQRGH